MKHNSTHETLLARWIEGNITTEEAQLLAEMENLHELKEMLTSLEEVKLPPMDLDAAWNELAPKTVQIKKSSPTLKTTPTKGRSLRPMLMRVAAVVALIVGVGFWYSMNVMPQKYFAQAGHTEKVLLPDGSEVTLNSGSSLEYSKWSWKKNRKIQLQGEAYFRVAKGEKFTVVTNHGETSVLGTQFDVYDRGATFQVKCFEGRVQVADANQASIITKGQGVKIANNIVKKMNVAAQNPAWINGESKFFENTLQEVFDEMKRQYILDIEMNQVDLSQQFTGVLPNKNLKKALAIICGSMNLSYKIDEDNKQIKITSK